MAIYLRVDCATGWLFVICLAGLAIGELAGVAALGLVSAAVAQLPIGDAFAGAAGLTYVLNFAVYAWGGRRRRALRRGV